MKKIDYQELIEKFFLDEISEKDKDILCKWLLEDKNNIRKYIKEVVMLNDLQREFSEKPTQRNIKFPHKPYEMSIGEMELISAAEETEKINENFNDSDIFKE